MTEANYDYSILQSEGVILAASRQNWVDDYASLDADVKYFLEGLCSNLAAIYVLNYDMDGAASRTEVENRINILRDASLRDLAILRDQKTKTFLSGA